MAIKAVLHNKCIQMFVTRDDLFDLATEGEVEAYLQDNKGGRFGKATLTITPLARVATLEHLEYMPPDWLVDQVGDEREFLKGDK